MAHMQGGGPFLVVRMSVGLLKLRQVGNIIHPPWVWLRSNRNFPCCIPSCPRDHFIKFRQQLFAFVMLFVVFFSAFFIVPLLMIVSLDALFWLLFHEFLHWHPYLFYLSLVSFHLFFIVSVVIGTMLVFSWIINRLFWPCEPEL